MGKAALRILVLAFLLAVLVLLVPSSTPVAIGECQTATAAAAVERAV